MIYLLGGVGLVIAVMILGIVWQSGRAVLTRMLDGVDPGGALGARARGLRRRDPGRRAALRATKALREGS